MARAADIFPLSSCDWLARRYGIKNFDMALVFKDFNRAVHRIDCIPIGTVDKIKEWLNR